MLEGRILFTDEGAEVQYVIRDHLGNTRVTFSDQNGDGQIDPRASSTEIHQENHYYPFGLTMHKPSYSTTASPEHRYQYNGKERDPLTDWIDYGARWYDPAIARWGQVDPLADIYNSYSPYCYVVNTPVNAVDPDGRLVLFISGYLFKDALSSPAGNLAHNWYTAKHSALWPTKDAPYYLNEDQNYWKGFDETYIEDMGFKNEEIRYYNATDAPSRGASSRYKRGYNSGLVLAQQLQNDDHTICLAPGETIKIVAHSMGAAFAAGLTEALVDAQLGHLIENVDYFSPHAVQKFDHPSSVHARQFSTNSDKVSKNDGMIDGVRTKYSRPSYESTLGGHLISTWLNSQLWRNPIKSDKPCKYGDDCMHEGDRN